MSPKPKPEAEARETIDAALGLAGWLVQDFEQLNLSAGCGVAVREFPLERGHGHADYALYVDGKLAGIVEAKEVGITLSGVEVQSEKYSTGVPADIPAHIRPLPFLYESTGVETQFTNRLDPQPRSRRVFSFHRLTAADARGLASSGAARAGRRDRGRPRPRQRRCPHRPGPCPRDRR